MEMERFHKDWAVTCRIALLLAVVAPGCTSEDGPELIPVSGKVLLDGSPLSGAGVSYRPDATRGNTAPYLPAGTTDPEGNYILTTAARPGAPPGWYTVVVTPPVPPMAGGEAPKAAPPPFAAKYTDEGTSDLSIEVKEGASPSDYELRLTK